MEHFFENIEGWFSFPQLYKLVVLTTLDNYQAHFVEVGAWYGRSAAYMAVEIANSGKEIQFDVVDTWEGSIEHQKGGSSEDKNIAEKGSIYEEFLNNMKPVSEYYKPIKMTSLEAAKLYPNGSLDFVLLDASHEYQDVLNDIAAWYPKLKITGVLGGDDITWGSVAKAVYTYFPCEKVSRFAPQSNDWIIFPNVGPLGCFLSEKMNLASTAGMIWHHLAHDNLETAKFILQKLNDSLYKDYLMFNK